MQQLTEERTYNPFQSLLALSPFKTLQWFSIASRVITKLFSIPHFSLIILLCSYHYWNTHTHTHRVHTHTCLHPLKNNPVVSLPCQKSPDSFPRKVPSYPLQGFMYSSLRPSLTSFPSTLPLDHTCCSSDTRLLAQGPCAFGLLYPSIFLACFLIFCKFRLKILPQT